MIILNYNLQLDIVSLKMNKWEEIMKIMNIFSYLKTDCYHSMTKQLNIENLIFQNHLHNKKFILIN